SVGTPSARNWNFTRSKPQWGSSEFTRILVADRLSVCNSALLRAADCQSAKQQIANLRYGGGRDMGTGNVSLHLRGKTNVGAVVGAKLVLVMGHTDCGAVKGACDHVQLGNLTGLLDKIQPAVEAVRDVPGERNSKNS